VQALIATDVAARGIDVRDIARVIQVEPPTDVETYTHRSGRTGRAGKQGTSVLFVAPSHYRTIARGLERAKIAHSVEPIPDPRRFSARAKRSSSPGSRERRRHDRPARDLDRRAYRQKRCGRDGPGAAHRKGRVCRVLPELETFAPSSRLAQMPPSRMPRGKSDAHKAQPGATEWVTFRVTWGGLHGADARRLLAMTCRRGSIRGSDVGAIRIESGYSLIDVARPLADAFEAAVAAPDPRNPKVRITRAQPLNGPRTDPPQRLPNGPRAEPVHRPPHRKTPHAKTPRSHG
jgi:ATP-dependent RNA helicase DeaD